jgi:exo-1,4-beta-D-glucosaminidase
MTTEPAENGVLVKLQNTSEVIAYQVVLKAKDAEGQLIAGPLWSDNFFSLAPGESRTVRCAQKDLTITLEGWNL